MEDKTKKVSIIVPAYNVDKYIAKCLNSIILQTYQNIEIIAIDDGSTDKTAIILDDYRRKDNRMIVIHKENAGVSEARNSGIEISNGDYIVFVDADDFLDSKYVEYMLSLANISGSDFCMSKRCFTKVGECQSVKDDVKKLSPDKATALLLSPEVIVGCWNKMFKRDFLIKNNLRFSSSLFYGEGLHFITRAAELANCVIVGERKVYYYRRNNELSATTQFNIEKIINGEKALKIIREEIINDSPEINIMWKLHMCMFCLGALTKVQANNCKKAYRKEYEHWLSYIRKNYMEIFKSKNVSKYRKAMLFGGCLSPWIMMKLDVARRKRIAKASV